MCFDIVSLGAFRAIPLPFRRHHNAHTLKVEPLDPAVRRVASDHLRDLVMRTPADAVQLGVNRNRNSRLLTVNCQFEGAQNLSIIVITRIGVTKVELFGLFATTVATAALPFLSLL